MSTNSGFTKKCHPHLKQLLKETKNVFKDLVDLTQLNIFTKAEDDSTNVDEDVANGRSTPCYTINNTNVIFLITAQSKTPDSDSGVPFSQSFFSSLSS